MQLQKGGDDLDDDFVIDDTVIFSENEGETLSDRGFLSDNGDAGASGEEEPGDDDVPDNDAENSGNAVLATKRKRSEKSKVRKAKKRKMVDAADLAQKSIACMSPQELSDSLTSNQAKVFPDASAIELEDMRIPATSIADTISWSQPRKLDQLADFIVEVVPTLHKRLSQKSKNNGAPTLLFVVGAALRAADVTRVLRDTKLRGDKGGEVAKLFARHFKLSEHVEYLKRTKVGAAVGTPGRMGKLLCETDALTVSALSHIFLDVTHQDAKKRTLLDIPETRIEIFKMVLGAPDVQKAIKEGKIQVVLF